MNKLMTNADMITEVCTKSRLGLSSRSLAQHRQKDSLPVFKDKEAGPIWVTEGHIFRTLLRLKKIKPLEGDVLQLNLEDMPIGRAISYRLNRTTIVTFTRYCGGWARRETPVDPPVAAEKWEEVALEALSSAR